jgi:hypothetical protein
MLATSLEKPEVGFILAGISCSSHCLIIILLGSVVIYNLGEGIVTQPVNCLTSLDLNDSAV